MKFLKPIKDNIPSELKAIPQWVCWKVEKREGKPTKPPYNPKTGKYAQSNNPETWASFDTAWGAFETNGYDGVGFVVTGGDPFVGIDIDRCIEKETGKISSEASSIMEGIPTYWEKSPSGEGLRGITRGELPPGGNKKGKVEFYETGRYLTITGHALNDHGIESRQSELEQIHHSIFQGKASSSDHPSRHDLDKQTPLDRAFKSKNGDKIQRLYNGDWANHPSQSEADQALCNYLAFWLDRDPGAIDQAFRSSGLMREKWDAKHYGDGRTYGEVTIQKAIASTIDTHHQMEEQPRQRGTQDQKPTEKIVVMQKFSPRPFSEDLKKRFRLKYDKFKRFFLYDPSSGLWSENAETILEVELRRNLLGAELLKKHYVAEILADVKSLSYDTKSAEEPPLNFIPFFNGAYDLDSGKLLPFTPEMFFTSKLTVNFNPQAKSPLIDRVFSQIVEKPLQLYELISYCFYRDYPYQKFFFLYGAGGNGKSVFSNIVGAVLGHGNIRSITPEQFQNNRFAAADLSGKFANLAGEIKYEVLKNTDILKRLVGGDLIRAERKYGDPFYFTNYAKLIFNTNELPRTTDKTRAFYRRLYMIEFPHKFEGENEDKMLMLKITKEELEGLAFQCIGYLQNLREKGFFFTMDTSTDDLAGQYEQLTNPLSEFIRENTEGDVNGFIPKWIFAKVLNYWQRFKGYREWSDAEIGKEMAFLGYDTKQKALTGEDIKSMISRISRQFPTSSHMRNGGCILPALPALPASGGKSWRVWIGLTWPSIVDKPLKHEDFGTADEYFEAKG